MQDRMVKLGCLAGLLVSMAGVGMSQEPVHEARGAASPAFEGTRAVAPLCPGELARATHAGGVVILRVLVGKDGAIESLSVVSGPEQLRGSATKAVAQWKYSPYLVDGRATEVYKTVEVEYQLGR